MRPKIVQISAIDVSMNNMLNLLNKRTQEKGFEVHCICSPGSGVEKIIERGYIYHPVKIDRNISLINNIMSIYNIYKVLKKEKPEIVHVHTPIASVLGRIAAKLAGIENVIYTAHGFYFHEGMNRKRYKLFYNIEKFIGKYFTDYLFTQSEEDYLLAKKNSFLKNENNYLHISNGIDINEKFNYDKFNPRIKKSIREKYNVSDDDLLVVFVGRLVKEKGIIDILNAFENIKDNSSIKLLALGDAPESERDKSIRNIIDSFDSAYVNFTGRVNNVEEFLYASDVFVLPSYREGMPRSIIEAMAMRNAIIATDIRGSREEVDNEVNGYLVSINSPHEISARLTKLNKDKTVLEGFKKSSYNKAKELYDEEEVVKKQLLIYKKLINKNYV